MHNWYSEIQKFYPAFRVLPYFGAAQKERKLLRKMWSNPQLLSTRDAPFHVLITNYQLIVSDEKHFSSVKWQYVILDEAQAIKSSNRCVLHVLLKCEVCDGRLSWDLRVETVFCSLALLFRTPWQRLCRTCASNP